MKIRALIHRTLLLGVTDEFDMSEDFVESIKDHFERTRPDDFV